MVASQGLLDFLKALTGLFVEKLNSSTKAGAGSMFVFQVPGEGKKSPL